MSDICLCGFREDNHVSFKIFEGLKVDEMTEEVIKAGMMRMQSFYIEQKLMYGNAACFEYRRNNLIYLETESLKREVKNNE